MWWSWKVSHFPVSRTASNFRGLLSFLQSCDQKWGSLALILPRLFDNPSSIGSCDGLEDVQNPLCIRYQTQLWACSLTPFPVICRCCCSHGCARALISVFFFTMHSFTKRWEHQRYPFYETWGRLHKHSVGVDGYLKHQSHAPIHSVRQHALTCTTTVWAHVFLQYWFALD